VTLIKIGNKPMRYAWGAQDLLPDFLGVEQDGEPWAEIWFGTHKTAPAQTENGSLADLTELGFMVKFLAAAAPLSIQAHPSKERAARLFTQGHQGYQDGNHKPEMLIAVTEFRALCGFRSEPELAQDLELLAKENTTLTPWLDALRSQGIQGAVDWVYDSGPSEVAALVASATVLGRKRARLIEQLFDLYPGDLGILTSLMMNLVQLEPGEAIFVPAGMIHAYLFGLGVEVMASSDNVMRGGLTPKHVDVKELKRVLDYRPTAEPRVLPKRLMQGLTQFPAEVDDFSVYRLEPSAAAMLIDLELRGQGVIVCVAGDLEVSTSTQENVRLSVGEAVYIANSRLFSITGNGTGYLAMG